MLTLILFSLTFTMPQHPRQPHTQRQHYAFRWYMREDGKPVKCTGLPYHVLLPNGTIKKAVLGCSGKFPQIILKD
jgi:hypothetical protein